MIIVQARLLHGSAYFAGEEVECQLTFSNPPKPDGVLRLSSDIETLAWCTAQIHCQCTLSAPNLDGGPGVDGSTVDQHSPDSTYFNPTRGERGVTVMISQPRILFCNIKLAPGEKTVYDYKERIPMDGVPPSFRGTFVKYSYKLTIGTQRPDSAISEIRLSFRVLTVDGLKEMSTYINKDEELAPSNPFQLCEKGKETKPEHTVRDLALQLLSEQSGKRRHNCYNISNLHGKVAKIIMNKNSYKIGDDLYCTFDFSEATIQCLQVTVTLQSVEEMANEQTEREKGSIVISHANHLEICLHMSKANVALPIPLHITPSFKSDHVSLTWKLHIEFITLTTPIEPQCPPPQDTQGTHWHGVTNLETETIHWDLPITVLSNNPLQCGLLQSLRSEETITLD
ncbi:RAB6A-GEF complex partner protein 2-like [Watersipora subatra]|uniref:RAB6A-GEF complex partner protein 2-like n=1 Tax=Watersipora subatra TaxID=2589382 RepID=UPI00355C6DB1